MKGLASYTSSDNDGDERDYQAEDDFRTLQRADEVTSSKDRHTRALAHGKKQLKSMSRVVSRGRR